MKRIDGWGQDEVEAMALIVVRHHEALCAEIETLFPDRLDATIIASSLM